MPDRQALKDALRLFADSYTLVMRDGLDRVRGLGLMYDVQDPKFLGLWIDDLRKLSELFDEMVAEDGGERL